MDTGFEIIDKSSSDLVLSKINMSGIHWATSVIGNCKMVSQQTTCCQRTTLVKCAKKMNKLNKLLQM